MAFFSSPYMVPGIIIRSSGCFGILFLPLHQVQVNCWHLAPSSINSRQVHKRVFFLYLSSAHSCKCSARVMIRARTRPQLWVSTWVPRQKVLWWWKVGYLKSRYLTFCFWYGLQVLIVILLACENFGAKWSPACETWLSMFRKQRWPIATFPKH